MLLLLTLLPLLAVSSFAAKFPDIENLHEVDRTTTSVKIGWTLDTSSMSPLKYSLLIANVITQEFLPTTTYLIANLQPCEIYNLTLKAIFSGGENAPSSINASTLYEVPSGVENLMIVNNTVSWSKPSNNANCVDSYRVCYTSHTMGTTDCKDTTDLSLDISALPGCDYLLLTVSALTGDGQRGPLAELRHTTQYAVPGAPTNFIVRDLGNFSASLTWDLPVENPACVKDFTTTVGVVDAPEQTVHIKTHDVNRNQVMSPQYHETINNLLPCTNYTISVQFISVTQEDSEPAVDGYQSENLAPTAIPGLSLVPDKDEIVVRWTDIRSHKCLAQIQICYHDLVGVIKHCSFLDVEPYLVSMKVGGLSPCLHYSFVVVGLSPIGERGPAVTLSTTTLDDAPGSVTALKATALSSNSMSLRFSPPKMNPQCVVAYTATYTNTMEDPHQAAIHTVGDTVVLEKPSDGPQQITITGLEPCATYQLEVHALSATGLAGHKTSTTQQTKSEAPGPIQNGRAVGATDITITLYWQAPEDRFCADHYKVNFIETIGNTSTLLSYSPKSNPLELIHTFKGGLTPCTEYTVDMWSLNDHAPGPGTYFEDTVTTKCN